MVATKSPAFRFYPSDFLYGCRRMTTEQIGIYILLLCEQWDAGIVPNDETMLKQITKCKKMDVINRVLEKFSRDENGDFFNQRLEKERDKQNQRSERLRANGMKGGRPKVIDNQSEGKPDGLQIESNDETKQEPKNKASVSVSVSGSTYKESIGETNVSTPAPPAKVKKKREPKIFIAPSIQEIQNYLKEYTRTWSDDQAHGKAFAIHNYYQANGWKVGKNPMKDWKAAVRTWLQRDGIVPLKDGQMSLLGNGQNTQTNLPDARKLAEKYQ